MLLITHFAWSDRGLFYGARSTSSEGCQRTQRVSPWWDDTFYEHGTQALIDTMDLVQNVILQTEYHLSQAQVETNLARKTAQILSSSSTRSAQTAYTWWDWVLRGCAVGSTLIFSFTPIPMLLFPTPHQISKASTNTILTLSPLRLPTLQRLK